MTFTYQQQANWPQVVGQNQSPINLAVADAQPERWSGLVPALRGNMAENTEFNLQIRGGGLTQIGGRTATFDQLHFHVPGEHVVDGRRGVMAAHFVHHFSDGQKAVVAVPLMLGTANPVLAAGLLLPETPLELPINLNGLIPQNAQWYHYQGSLTTPPVEENVAWYVAARFLTISAAQLATYQQRFPRSNQRDLQPRNGRPVLILHE